jgi:hypothetical protein
MREDSRASAQRARQMATRVKTINVIERDSPANASCPRCRGIPATSRAPTLARRPAGAAGPHHHRPGVARQAGARGLPRSGAMPRRSGLGVPGVRGQRGRHRGRAAPLSPRCERLSIDAVDVDSTLVRSVLAALGLPCAPAPRLVRRPGRSVRQRQLTLLLEKPPDMCGPGSREVPHLWWYQPTPPDSHHP